MTEPQVFQDKYQCPECGCVIELADFSHRTHVGYTAASIRCHSGDCTDKNGNPPAMERIT